MKYRLKKDIDVTVKGRGIHKPSDLSQMVRRMRPEEPFAKLMGSLREGELLFGCYDDLNEAEVFHVDSRSILAEYEHRFADGAFRMRSFFAVPRELCEPCEPTVEPSPAMLTASDKPPVLARQGPYE